MWSGSATPSLTTWTKIPLEAGTVAHNLPISLTGFIGREGERLQIRQMLQQTRLVTLTGLGGVGKTRLAQQVAWESLPYFRDGVYFVPLARVESAAAVWPALARVLLNSLCEEPNLQTLVFDYLRDKEMLLVLDNFEQLLPAACWLIEILQQAPQVRLLVTSRERLHLSAESLFEVEGLCVLPAEFTEFMECDAVQLFLHSARRVCPNYLISAQDRPYVARLCQHVAGLPLALELAATWLRVWSCREIALQIEQDLGFLVSDWQDLPERQRSIRTVFEHSWMLLTESEQRWFSQLSVFRGSFTRQAAAEVMGATAQLLTSLTDKTLLRWSPALERYELHDLLKQYAAEKLAQTPAVQEQTQGCHGEYFLRLLHDQGQALNGPEQQSALKTLAEEIENICEAWQWASEHLRFDWIESCLADLASFFMLQGRSLEGRGLLTAALKELKAARPDSKVVYKLLAQQSALLSLATEADTAQAQLHECLAFFQAEADWAAAAFCLSELGDIAVYQTDYQVGYACFEQALALARQTQSHELEASLLRRLGNVHSYEGRQKQARECYEQARTIYQALGDRWGESGVLNNLGIIFSMSGNYPRAVTCHQQSLQIYRQSGNRYGEVMGLINLGLLARYLGNFADVQCYSQQALQIAQELGDMLHEGYALMNWGSALLGLEQWEQAEAICQRAIALLRQLGKPHLAIEPFIGRIRISLARNDLAQARVQVEEVWSYLEGGHTFNHTGEPFQHYLTCYQALRAMHDPRARDILRTAYQRLQESAVQLPDETEARLFWENVAAHRELASEFAKVWGQPASPAPSLNEVGNYLIDPLSQREVEVLRFIVAGLTNQEIARDLCISLNTVKTHTKSIYSKLHVNNRTQAVKRSRELNLV